MLNRWRSQRLLIVGWALIAVAGLGIATASRRFEAYAWLTFCVGVSVVGWARLSHKYGLGSPKGRTVDRT